MSNLKATKRENLSSGSNNKLRAKGFIPAILYGGKDQNQKVSISKKLLKILIEKETKCFRRTPKHFLMNF